MNFALLSEGSSDRALLPILEWTLAECLPDSVAIDGSWVDTSRLPPAVISTPRDRLRSAADIYACDVLFIHRDEDGIGWERRNKEIQGWVLDAELGTGVSPVAVIPVQATEAWLLVDKQAIRSASSNPNGKSPLDLPKVHEVEGLANPKQVLFAALRAASELSGRKLKKFDRSRARSDVANYMTRKILLRQLPAFQRLEGRVRELCQSRQWA